MLQLHITDMAYILIKHCAWCTGGTSNLPKLPEGFGYTSGICKKHVVELRKNTSTPLHANLSIKTEIEKGGE